MTLVLKTPTHRPSADSPREVFSFTPQLTCRIGVVFEERISESPHDKSANAPPVCNSQCATLFLRFVRAAIRSHGADCRPRRRSQPGHAEGQHPPARQCKERSRPRQPRLPMTDLILVLSRDPAQQAAFEKFVASQYDSNSPTSTSGSRRSRSAPTSAPPRPTLPPSQAGSPARDSPSTTVTKDRMSIRFSGNAAQVQSTFHTEIHNLTVKGEAHIGNMSDPQIPAALAPVVVGVKSLHNFFPRPCTTWGVSSPGMQDRPMASPGQHSRRFGFPHTACPAQRTSSIAPHPRSAACLNSRTAVRHQRPRSGTQPYRVEDVGPYDFATIYNILPLWNQGIDGSGQTIAIAGTSSIDANDVATFRTSSCPATRRHHAPILISGNSSPLTVCTSTTGTVPYPTAPCTSTTCSRTPSTSSGPARSHPKPRSYWLPPIRPQPPTTTSSTRKVTSSIPHRAHHERQLRLVRTRPSAPPAMCSTTTCGKPRPLKELPSSSQPAIPEQPPATPAATPVACPPRANYGTSVSGLASTPYNTAVGGTDFNWCSLTTTANALRRPTGAHPTPHHPKQRPRLRS